MVLYHVLMVVVMMCVSCTTSDCAQQELKFKDLRDKDDVLRHPALEFSLVDCIAPCTCSDIQSMSQEDLARHLIDDHWAVGQCLPQDFNSFVYQCALPFECKECKQRVSSKLHLSMHARDTLHQAVDWYKKGRYNPDVRVLALNLAGCYLEACGR